MYFPCEVAFLEIPPNENFPKLGGTLFGGPHNEDHSISGSVLGSPYFGKLSNVIGMHLSPQAVETKPNIEALKFEFLHSQLQHSQASDVPTYALTGSRRSRRCRNETFR